jgi:hypothetical protein
MPKIPVINRLIIVADKDGNYYQVISTGFGGKNPILKPIIFTLSAQNNGDAVSVTEEQFKNNYLNAHCVYFNLADDKWKPRIVR